MGGKGSLSSHWCSGLKIRMYDGQGVGLDQEPAIPGVGAPSNCDNN